MTAREFMTREFPVLHPDDPVEEVVRRLKSSEVDPLPVCDGDRLVGVVNYRDLAARVGGAGRRGRPVRARDVVAEDVIYCRETTALEEAVALMRDNQVRSLPVLNADGRLVGILPLASVPEDLVPPRSEGSPEGRT
jgi:CBS domain-containing protein